MANIKILGIAGSLRKASFNRLALKAAQGLVPAGATLDILDLPDLPGFNQDNEKSPPRGRDRAEGQDPRRRRHPARHARVQLLDPRRAQERHRLGPRPYGDSAWKGKPVGDHGRLGRRARHGAGAISPAPVLCVPRHARRQPARGHDQRCAPTIRRGRQPHRRDRQEADRPAAGQPVRSREAVRHSG